MKKIYSIICGFALLASGCNFLDIVPEDDIQTIETVFEQRSKVDGWVATCYRNINSAAAVNSNPAYTGADELVGNDLHRYGMAMFGNFDGLLIADGLQSSMNVLVDSWTNSSYYATIRYCNTFFQHIGETRGMSQEEKDLWTAEVKAAKAHCYFKLVQKYGPIVLMDEPIGVNEDIEDMQLPRLHVDTCFNEIVRLLDEAIAVLPVKAEKRPDRQGYFCKESAMALKAVVLVYQASPLYNGNPAYAGFTEKDGSPLFSATVDKEKWHRAAVACDEAIDLLEDQNYGLVEGNSSERTPLLNTMKDIEQSVQAPGSVSEEFIMMAKQTNDPFPKLLHYHGHILPVFRQASYQLNNPPSNGALSPSMKMVEMYYTVNGLPISEDPTWAERYSKRYQLAATPSDVKYTGVIPPEEYTLNLHLDREPRFYANIVFDRGYWRGAIKNAATEKMNPMVVEARKGERFGTDLTYLVPSGEQNRTGYWLTKFIFTDLTVDNYLEQVKAKGDIPMPVLRMAELYLMQSEAWNEYLDNPLDTKVLYGINKVRTRAGIPTVERSWGEIAGSTKHTTKEGMREIIQQETNIELAFEGKRFWNLRRWLKGEELNQPRMGWNVVGSTAEAFYNNFEGPVQVWNLYGFRAPRDYLWPINSEEVMKSGFVQNPGW